MEVKNFSFINKGVSSPKITFCHQLLTLTPFQTQRLSFTIKTLVIIFLMKPTFLPLHIKIHSFKSVSKYDGKINRVKSYTSDLI